MGTNEDTHNQKTTFSMVSSSSATNPMDNTHNQKTIFSVVSSSSATNPMDNTHNQKTTFSVVSSSSASNPMDNAVMFCRTQFLHSTGPDLHKIAKNHSFGRLFWSTKGKNEETYNPKTAFSLISSSSTTNPMENTAMFRRTPFLTGHTCTCSRTGNLGCRSGCIE